jgi:hypothetical protein
MHLSHLSMTGPAAVAGLLALVAPVQSGAQETFKVAWVSRSAFDIFDQIRKLMPEDNPGILSAQQYADVVAYMFSLNGYPAGQAELPAQDEPLKRVKIDAPPRPSPDDAAALAALRRYQQRLLR